MCSCEDDDKSYGLKETSEEYITWKTEMYETISNNYAELKAKYNKEKAAAIEKSAALANEKINNFKNTEWEEYKIGQDTEGFYIITKTTYKYAPYKLEDKTETVWSVSSELASTLPTVPAWDTYYETAYEEYKAVNPPPAN